MLAKRLRRDMTIASLALLIALIACRPASADLVYATSISTGTIYVDNTATHVVTPVFNTGQDIDSLFFDPAGRIIYHQLFLGKIFAYDPAHGTNTLLYSEWV